MVEAKRLLEKDSDRRLWISRVPKGTKSEFVKFAEDQFEDDFGMALKHIWDSYKERSEVELIAETVIGLDERVKKLEGVDVSDEIRLLSGKKIDKEEK